MTVVKRVRQLVLIGAAAAAVAVPNAGAKPIPAPATGAYVQIGGELVAPSQVSAYQQSAGSRGSSHLVQIGGELVAPSQVSAFQADATPPATTSSDDGGFDWNASGIELVLLGALVFLAGVLGVLWRRGRLTTA